VNVAEENVAINAINVTMYTGLRWFPWRTAIWQISIITRQVPP